MAEYWIYSLDHERLVRSLFIAKDCRDDEGAFALARSRLNAFRQIEIWSGNRLVGRLSPLKLKQQASPQVPEPVQPRRSSTLRPASVTTLIRFLQDRGMSEDEIAKGLQYVETAGVRTLREGFVLAVSRVKYSDAQLAAGLKFRFE